MRVECESCRELFAASFAVERDGVRATCSACRHIMHAPLAAEPAPHSDGAALCPKCGTPRGDASACATCGLSVARMAAYTDARDAEVPAAVRTAWQRVTDEWTDRARHDELLRVVSAHNSYAWAAGRYRTRSDELAVRQLERLRRAAEATLLAGATARPDRATTPYRATRGVLMILIVAVLVGLVYAMVMRERRPAVRAPTPPARPLEAGHPVSPSTIR